MDLNIVIPFALLVGLILIGMPIAFGMALAGYVGLTMVLGSEAANGVLTTSPYRHATSYLLTTVPMFILMAEFLSKGTIVRDLFESASHWTGRFRGGLAMSAVLANTGFAALSGSSTAAAASISKISVPQMRSRGYHDRLSVGTVAAAGTFAATLPPSIGLIIYGVQTETSIGALFVAGIIPGLLTAAAYLLGIAVWVRFRPDLAGEVSHSSWAQRFGSLKRTWPSVLLVVALIGSIYAGVVTPTEAGALGALLALGISITLGGLRWAGIRDSLRGTVRATGMIVAIVIGAAIFGTYLSSTRAAPRLFDAIEAAGLPGWSVMVLVVIMYLVLGMFMDAIAMMMLTLPLTFPLALELGYSPIWFGILVIKCAEIGLISPPLGLNVFVAAEATSARISEAFRGSSRFILIELLLIVGLFIVPGVATFLPSKM